MSDILRPGDLGFAEAFKYAPLWVKASNISDKIQLLFDAQGREVNFILIASTNGKIIAIPEVDFSYYYNYTDYSAVYEKQCYAELPVETFNTDTFTYLKPQYASTSTTTIGYGTSGRAPAIVVPRNKPKTRAVYWDGYQWVEDTFNNEENEMIDNKLYVVLDGEHKGKYVNKVAVNSAGHFVVEAKGESAYFAVAKESLERVLPYSVDVKFYSNGSLGDKLYSYWAKEGDVAVGDVIFGENSNASRVVAINTKSDSAAKWLVGSVIKPAKVLTGE